MPKGFPLRRSNGPSNNSRYWLPRPERGRTKSNPKTPFQRRTSTKNPPPKKLGFHRGCLPIGKRCRLIPPKRGKGSRHSGRRRLPGRKAKVPTEAIRRSGRSRRGWKKTRFRKGLRRRWRGNRFFHRRVRPSIRKPERFWFRPWNARKADVRRPTRSRQ